MVRTIVGNFVEYIERKAPRAEDKLNLPSCYTISVDVANHHPRLFSMLLAEPFNHVQKMRRKIYRTVVVCDGP